MKITILTTPQSQEFFKQVAEKIFLPLKNHYCLACMFVAGGGKRTIITYLLREEKILQNIFKEKYATTLFVYIDTDELLEISNVAYLTLMLEKINKDAKERKININIASTNNPLNSIKQALTELTDAGFNVVFILNDFEITFSFSPSIFLNLETLMAVNKSKIAFLFLASTNLLAPDNLSKLHNLKYAVSQKYYYFPLFAPEQIEYLLKQISEKLQTPLTPELKNLLIKLCGGHPQLIKYASNILIRQAKHLLTSPLQACEYILRDRQLQIVCHDIWQALCEQEKTLLQSVVKTNRLPTISAPYEDFLRGTGIVRKNKDGKDMLFSEIFHEFVIKQIPQEKLFFDQNANQIFFGLKNCGNIFTLQEFKLLSFLIQHEGKVVSRDEVAECLWGKDYLDKYSDWAIDKTVSVIRKKLVELGYQSGKLATLKKRGFYLTQ